MSHIQIEGDLAYPIGINIGMNKSLILNMAHVMTRAIGSKTPVALWCMGSSGAILAAIISLSFEDCVINHVKKDGENSHSSNEYTLEPSRKQIIVDDFIRSGKTVNAIYSSMHYFNIRKVDYLCVYEGVSQRFLRFLPDVVISGYYQEELFQKVIDDLISL